MRPATLGEHMTAADDLTLIRSDGIDERCVWWGTPRRVDSSRRARWRSWVTYWVWRSKGWPDPRDQDRYRLGQYRGRYRRWTVTRLPSPLTHRWILRQKLIRASEV